MRADVHAQAGRTGGACQVSSHHGEIGGAVGI
jgi:hypothetical protein